jgi:DNA-binding transcriptional regulator YbjK
MAVKRRDAETTRAAILDATLRLIGERGLEAVRHRSVAEAAGVSLGTISNHFGTRDELLREAVVTIGKRERERVDGWTLSLLDNTVDFDAWLSVITAEIASGIANEPTRWLALLEMQLAAARRPELLPVMTEVRDAYRRVVTLGFRAAGTDISASDADVLVAAVTGAVLKQLAYQADDFDEGLKRLVSGLILGRSVTPAESA